MNEKFQALKEKAKQVLSDAKTTREVFELRAGFLGKSGEITGLMKMMK